VGARDIVGCSRGELQNERVPYKFLTPLRVEAVSGDLKREASLSPDISSGVDNRVKM